MEVRAPLIIGAHAWSVKNGVRYKALSAGSALVAAGEWRALATGLRSPITFVGVSVWSYHPDYLSASASTESWLATLRGARLPVLRPGSWWEAARGGRLPEAGPGPTRARLADHVRVFEEVYLPARDEAGQPVTELALGALDGHGAVGKGHFDPRVDLDR